MGGTNRGIARLTGRLATAIVVAGACWLAPSSGARADLAVTDCAAPVPAAPAEPASPLRSPTPHDCAKPENPIDVQIRQLGLEPTGIRNAIAAYRASRISEGDAIAATIANPNVRTTLEWLALRAAPAQVGIPRLKAFAASHPDWTGNDWIRRQIEARLPRVQDPIEVERFFVDQAPTTVPGKFALARALKATGRVADGTRLARAIFRESDIPAELDAAFKAEFGADLQRSDYKYRGDRLFYKGRNAEALRYAARAGLEYLLLAKTRVSVAAGRPSDAMLASLPDALRSDPTLTFARIQRLRHADRDLDAAHLMETAPHNPALLVDADRWWTERRALARKLLDAGKVNAAYIMSAMATPVSPEARVEAEFHAGWIALRFLNEPARARYHFDVAATLAKTPTSVARIAYWQGRTAENSADPEMLASAKAFYLRAAAHGSTYYGQLARQAIGQSDTTQAEPHPALGDDRAEPVRAVELLYAAGEKDAGLTLATQTANGLADPRQVEALAVVIAREHDAHLALTIGKLVAQRGMPVDSLAFPTNGIPHYEALKDSAAAPIVYSVARQESAFLPRAVSKAGAKGLMQMIDATARRTASQAGIAFDRARMLRDASFNAKLGAAHLGTLIKENGGSLIMTFAAYNAGGGRVHEWVEAYGDPRMPGVDPVDWVERIPFAETRDYVQRVVANVAVYTTLLREDAKPDLIAQAMRERRDGGRTLAAWLPAAQIGDASR